MSKKWKAVDAADYVNYRDTDKKMSAELNNPTLVLALVEEDVPTETIKYETYLSISDEAMDWLLNENNVKLSDQNKVLKMARTVREGNIMRQANFHKHTKQSLSLLLGINQDETYKLLNRLWKKNILSYMPTYITGKEERVYIMNPYIVNKCKKQKVPKAYLEVFRPLKNNL